MNKLEVNGNVKDNKLPEGWVKIRLGEIIIENIKSGFKVENADNSGRYPFFTSGEAILSDSNYLVDYENVFLATGGVANIKYYKGKANYSADTYCLKAKITTKYLYYCLLKNLMKVDYKYFSGSGLKHLQKSDFKKEILNLPSLPCEQQKIAEILETVDETIEKTNAIIEKYKRTTQGLMQDLLTRGIDENSKIRSEETHKFKDSSLGRIPEEWEVVELGGNINVFLSNVDKKIFNFEQKVLLCNYLNVYKNEYINNLISFTGGSANIREIKKFGVSKGNVIITKDSEEFNDIAKSAYVRDEINNLICGYHLALLKPSKKVDGLYLSKILKLYKINSFFQRRANGITRFGISKETIEKALIPLPTLPEQRRIVSILSQIDETVAKEQKYKEKLERIKQGLMEDLLTGKVRILNVN
ncbi:restriction endonuclease subunit S [Candidatus Atribacteria bacterium HGW-Atribacteria-1]|nr:MAG: restriction endonuclease subunit S [Candidatus Atribacteria bacterium HGW-Atribacteria-1]